MHRKFSDFCPYDIECEESDYVSLERCKNNNYRDCPNYIAREQERWGWYWLRVRTWKKFKGLEDKIGG